MKFAKNLRVRGLDLIAVPKISHKLVLKLEHRVRITYVRFSYASKSVSV